MRPGDLVRVRAETELPDGAYYDMSSVGDLVGMVVREVELEDGHPVNSWCDWWVLLRDELSPFPADHLEVVQADRGSE